MSDYVLGDGAGSNWPSMNRHPRTPYVVPPEPECRACQGEFGHTVTCSAVFADVAWTEFIWRCGCGAKPVRERRAKIAVGVH